MLIRVEHEKRLITFGPGSTQATLSRHDLDVKNQIKQTKCSSSRPEILTNLSLLKYGQCRHNLILLHANSKGVDHHVYV